MAGAIPGSHGVKTTRPDAPAATPGARTRPPALALALAITLGITAYPHALAGPDGGADHWAAMAAFWAMSAGYVSGVGFRPRHALPRALFSGWSCLAAVALAGARLAWLWSH